jgi:uncharacterized SAM-binding protein YcdF (DUF218 family)
VQTYAILKQLLLPPGILVVLLTIAFFAVRGTAGRLLVFLSWAILLLMSLPMSAALLMSAAQTHPPLPPERVADTGAEAIVVLGGGIYRNSVEYGATTVDLNSMKRSRYAAWLHRRTGLPIYVAGGRGSSAPAPPMVRFLEDELGVSVAGLEDRSSNTWENATMMEPLLREAGIDRVLLVTDAWHMPRAVDAFLRVGLDPVPAPTYFVGAPPGRPPSDAPRSADVRDWLPQAIAFNNSYYAIHELLGAAFYALKAAALGVSTGDASAAEAGS